MGMQINFRPLSLDVITVHAAGTSPALPTRPHVRSWASASFDLRERLGPYRDDGDRLRWPVMARRSAGPPDPCDVGAQLRAAIDAAGLAAGEVARRTGIAPSNVSRALNNPDKRPTVARRILAAASAKLVVVPADDVPPNKGSAR
jgi:hypothetical protein